MADRRMLTREEVGTFQHQVSADLNRYLVIFLGIMDPRHPNEGQPVGSGTLVQIKGRYGVLTADHVVGALLATRPSGKAEYDWVGLLFSYVGGGNSHPVLLPKSEVQAGAVTIARHPTMQEASHPDLGFVWLVPTRVREIEQRGKAFYDLWGAQAKAQATNPQVGDGLWFLCGLPASTVTHEWLEAAQELQPEAESNCFIGGVDELRIDTPFDYYFISVDYRVSRERNQLPSSFGGMSGGGAWFVPVVIRPDDTFHIEEMIAESFLGGVIISQVKVGGVVEEIKFHGWRSVYKVALSVLAGTFSD